ncbi:MAG: glucose-1-phosphate adenylyltransferase, partial [Verrucomicrobia bacterium]|nr:glucose-1-phosphate adenylyltransferase [Verrucomicrobiota bacterium]
DLSALIEQHRETESCVTIAAKAMPREKVGGLGLMRVEDDLSILEFAEKPSDPKVIEGLTLSDKLSTGLPGYPDQKYVLANMGIYCFTMRVLREALDSAYTDFGGEVIPDLLGKVEMRGFIFDQYWEDIGTVRSFFEANLSLTDDVPPFNFFDGANPVYSRARFLPASKINGMVMRRGIIAGGCIISECELERVVIGVRAMIDRGTVFKNVVMMGGDLFENDEDRIKNRDLQRPDIGVGENCFIENAIIDKNARIGDNVRLSPEGKPDMFQSGDIIVRDGVLIVMKNGVVPDGTVV